ncbi:glycosyltransferase family 2 protein [Carnobacterium maltaromaticum]|uniref:glycosyltransferase family 2 protein n=1 Tax=Carnobacterium maltaromaticum TaxID=2751 RepID=UPI00298AF153|nr:glycosyltransferase family 2 protein [Carnobacterium maltaromaticum]MDW5525421.1 glycosyltransferase family 2 protein [Carnobacterium maltaromaticum]
MVEISFIIVNYNTKMVTEACIESLNSNKTLQFYNYEIIVVDNGSSDGSVKYLEKNENTAVIETGANNGFGLGNNIGAKSAKGRFLVLVNSDTIADKTNFKELINLKKKDRSIGILSCKILNEDSSIQSLGFEYPKLRSEFMLNILFWNFNFVKKIRMRNYINVGCIDVDWISGCFMIIEKSDFNLVEGFDKEIFMYAEDMDLSYRIKKKKVIYDKTEIFHLHGKSNSGKLTLKKLVKSKKSYYYVIKKNNLASANKLKIFKIMHLLHFMVLLNLKKMSGFIRRKNE